MLISKTQHNKKKRWGKILRHCFLERTYVNIGLISCFIFLFLLFCRNNNQNTGYDSSPVRHRDMGRGGFKFRMAPPYETYPFHLDCNRKKNISKCINNLSPIFWSFVVSESLIFMAGCDTICLTSGQKIRGLPGWHASKSTSLL